MSSSARPTFLPAVGGHSISDTQNLSNLRRAKDLPAHTTLKYRKQPSQDEVVSKTSLKRALVEREEAVKRTKTIQPSTIDKSDSESSSEEDDDDDSDTDSDDSEDDSTLLMLELQKIKQERTLLQQQQAQQSNQEVSVTGNPLLNNDTSFTVAKRWDTDVIFKNQSAPQKQKSFVNDLLRSDFHKKFINKYVK